MFQITNFEDGARFCVRQMAEQMPRRTLFTRPGEVDSTAHALWKRQLACHKDHNVVDVVCVGDVAYKISLAYLHKVSLNLDKTRQRDSIYRIQTQEPRFEGVIK